MARHVIGDKRTDIRNATVAEVVDNGYANTSIKHIATRAGLSVGSIYRHFSSKEHLLQTVYLEIKADLHQSLMVATQDYSTSCEKISAMWFAMLEYAGEHPNDFMFSEIVSNDIELTDLERKALKAMTAEIRGVIEIAVDDGTLHHAPAHIHMLVLSAPAIQLARTAALRGMEIDPEIADNVFSMLWKAVANQ